MHHRWLVNLLLLILVIALGALMRHELGLESRVATLTALLPQDIREVSIERVGQPTIRLVQGVDGWRMESPYQVPADEKRIAQLTGIAATPVQRSLPAGGDLEQLGVGADSLRLTLNRLVLRFGDVDPIDHQRYVAIGDQIHLIGDGFHHHLIAGAEDYISRRLLPSGFRVASGALAGLPLTDAQLTELGELSANKVQPLGSELVGRLLSLTAQGGDQSLRFLVSSDGLDWARLDLHLRYLLTTAPSWAVVPPAGDPEQGKSGGGDRDW